MCLLLQFLLLLVAFCLSAHITLVNYFDSCYNMEKLVESLSMVACEITEGEEIGSVSFKKFKMEPITKEIGFPPRRRHDCRNIPA